MCAHVCAHKCKCMSSTSARERQRTEKPEKAAAVLNKADDGELPQGHTPVAQAHGEEEEPVPLRAALTLRCRGTASQL